MGKKVNSDRRRQDRSQAEPRHEEHQQSSPEFTITQNVRKTRMEIATYVFGALATIAGILAGMMFSMTHFRDAGIWLTCAAICFTVIATFCWFQDRAWKQDATEPSSSPAASNAARDEENDPVYRKDFGWLEPANDPTPPGWSFSSNSPSITEKHVVALFFGTSAGAVTIQRGERIPVVSFLEDETGAATTLLEIGLKDGKATISGRFTDKDGNITGMVKENSFVINDRTAFWPEMPDKSTIIVRDQSGDEVLNLRFLNPNAFLYTGKIRSPDGQHFILVTEEMIQDENGNSRQHFFAPGPYGLIFTKDSFNLGNIRGVTKSGATADGRPPNVP